MRLNLQGKMRLEKHKEDKIKLDEHKTDNVGQGLKNTRQSKVRL